MMLRSLVVRQIMRFGIGSGNVGIIRSPLRATVLPDWGGRGVNSRPYRDCGRGERATVPPMPILSLPRASDHDDAI